MNGMNILKIVGSLLGIAAFLWKIWDSFQSYIHIDIQVSKDESRYVHFKTTIENKSIKPKPIDNAFLLLGPYDENPIKTFNEIKKDDKKIEDAEYTNDFAPIKNTDTKVVDNSRVIIPLSFYYSENVRIADGKLTYVACLEQTLLEEGLYSVRFYIWTKSRLHRSTHSVFSIN